MKRIFKILVLLLLLGNSVHGQVIDQYLHPSVWLRADLLNGIQDYWFDVSGNNHHGLCSNNLPPVALFNFNPGFKFDGIINPFSIAYDFGDLAKMTLIVVYKTSDLVFEKGVWSIIKDTSITQSLTTQRIGGETFSIHYRENNDTIGIVNTYGFTWVKSNADSVIDHFFIAGTENILFKGTIAECIIYPDIIQGKDLQIIQSYLCLKYGITLLDKSYMNSKGDILWNRKKNLEFNNGIFGIGRDTTLNLNQKQSFTTSSNDIIAIGAKTIDSTNQENMYQLNEGDFLVCGNNNKPPVIDYLDSSQTVGILQRHWLIQLSGNTITEVPTELKVDLSAILEDSMVCRLIVGRIADSGIDLTNIEYYSPDSITPGKIAHFPNIYWDTDHSGKDIFSIFFMRILPMNATNSYNPVQKNPNPLQAYNIPFRINTNTNTQTIINP